MEKQKVLKIIKKFEREHKKVYEEDGGECDCQIVYSQCHRIASKKEWLGTEEEWKKSKKEEKEMDKCIRCYVCEFIKELKKEVSIPKD